jgi:hypothetical protein
MKDFTTREQRLGIKDEFNFIQAFLVFIVILSLFYVLIDWKVERWAVDTCREWGDCAEVYKEYNIK